MRGLICQALVLCTIFLHASDAVGSPTSTSLEVVRAFLALNNKGLLQSAECRRLLSGEAATKWNVPSLGSLSEQPLKVVAIAPDRVAVHVLGMSENTPVVDVYLYLRNQRGWRVEAMRYLALTGIPEQVREKLHRKSRLTPAETYELSQLNLLLASDAALVKWFHQHRTPLIDWACSDFVDTRASKAGRIGRHYILQQVLKSSSQAHLIPAFESSDPEAGISFSSSRAANTSKSKGLRYSGTTFPSLNLQFEWIRPNE